MDDICAKQDSFNTTDNASSDVLFNRYLSEGQTPKQALQKWLQTYKFGHFITIEPTPCSPMKNDDMNQRLRKIDCLQNRKFIGNSYRKFCSQDRFWMVWFFENGHKGRTMRHLHLLTYFPFHQMNIGGSENYKKNMVKNYVLQLWYSTPYFNYLNDARPVCPMHIETIPTEKDSDRVAWYSTKQLDKRLEKYDHLTFSYR